MIDRRPYHIVLVSEPLNCDSTLSILTFFLFDCLTEGITTLLVFGYIPSHLDMVKCDGSRFQFYANAAIYARFLVRVGFNSHSGYNICYTLPDKLSHHIRVFVCCSQRLPGTFPSPRDQNNLEAWIPIGQTSVE